MYIRSVFISFLFLFNTAFAQTIIGIDIPGLHSSDGKGLYDVAIKDATGVKTLILSPARAVSSYDSCVDCCISPANKNPDFYEYGAGHIVSKPMFTAKIYIFSKPGSQVITDLDSLRGKKVGLRKGMPYGNKIENSGARFVRADKLTQNIKKLEQGRIEYMIAYTPDIYDVFDSIGKSPFPHAEAEPIAAHEDSLLCKDTPANRALIEKLNAGV